MSILSNLFDVAKREPAECLITVGGDDISDLYPLLKEVTVDCERCEASEARLVFETRRDETGRWQIEDDDRLREWRDIAIVAAFGAAHEEDVFNGVIVAVAPTYPADPGATGVTVVCQDESAKLDRQHLRRVWGGEAPTSDRQMLAEIVVKRHNLKLSADTAPGRSGLVVNQDSTDARFLRQRAEANGYELYFRNGEVYFGPMRLEAAPQQPILVYAGQDTNCLRFEPATDAHQPDQIAFDLADEVGAGGSRHVVRPNLPLLGPEPPESSSSGLDPFEWMLPRAPGTTFEELEAVAQRHANERAMKVRVEGELDGALYGHVLRAGLPVIVDGVGLRYSGTYYVDRVTHRFDARGYRQSFTLLRNAYGDNVP